MNKLQKHYLHIEGMDLAGKSTIANIITRQSGVDWKIYNNCLSQNNPIQQFEKQMRNQKIYDDEIYGYLHYVTLLADIKYFDLKENIIQDSMLLLRSINYHKEKNNNDLVQLFEELVPKHPIPNTSVYLTANIDSRKKRLLKRIESNSKQLTKNDILILNDSEKFEKRDKRESFKTNREKYEFEIIVNRKPVKLTIYKGDDINCKVKEFCNTYNLNFNDKRRIFQTISNQINN